MQVFNRTTVINNFDVDSRNRTFINHGIDPERITAVTRTEIHPVAIRDATGPVARGEQLGRDGRTLVVSRPHFTDNPPSSMNRGELPRATSPAPMVGSAYQAPRNGYENNNSSAPYNNHPAPGGPEPVYPNQPPHNGNQNNNNFQPPRNGQPVQTTPPIGLSPRYAPVTPVPPSSPNYNSTDDRRYPSPKAQQTEQQSPRVNQGNSGARVNVPVTPLSPPVEQPAPAPPPPTESRPNYSQPNAAGNQSHSATPAQSQRSGGGKNQNGQ